MWPSNALSLTWWTLPVSIIPCLFKVISQAWTISWNSCLRVQLTIRITDSFAQHHPLTDWSQARLKGRERLCTELNRAKTKRPKKGRGTLSATGSVCNAQQDPGKIIGCKGYGHSARLVRECWCSSWVVVCGHHHSQTWFKIPDCKHGYLNCPVHPCFPERLLNHITIWGLQPPSFAYTYT